MVGPTTHSGASLRRLSQDLRPRRHQPPRSVGVLLIAGVAVFALHAGLAQVAGADESCEEKPLVVKIHADWCSSCKAVESVWNQLRTDLGDEVRIVKLDVTDRVAFQESQQKAERLGLGEFFQKYRSQTGTIAVLRCDEDDPVAILTGERDLTKYREAISKAQKHHS